MASTTDAVERGAGALGAAGDATSMPWLSEKPHSAEETREQRHASEKDLLAADEVTQPPRQEQQAGVGDQIGVDHPGQIPPG